MFGAQAILCFSTICGVAAAAFRPRGTAPYSNATSITTPLAGTAPSVSTPLSQASTTSQTPPYLIYGSGTGITSEHGRPRPTGQGSVRPSAWSNETNSTESSCTVNIPNANIEWWYAATYNFAVGTLTADAANFTNNGGQYLTMIPNTDTWDVNSAISIDMAFTESPSYDPEFDTYWTYYEEYTVIPTAASTAIVTRNAAAPMPSGNVIPATDSLKYELDMMGLDVATTVIASAANSTSAVTSATPFVYFTAYEVESAANGSTTTKTVTLPQAQAYEFWVKGVESSPSATGDVPAEFLQQIPESGCSPGTVQGSVTVLVVLDLFYLHIPHANPFIVHFESTALGFEDSTSDDVVVAQETSRGQPFTLIWNFTPKPSAAANPKPSAAGNPQPSAAGGAKTTIADTLPQVQQTAPADTPGGSHNAGSNVPDVPQQTQVTVGTIGTNPVVVGPSSVVIVGTQTLQPGGPAVTIGGDTISVVPAATAIVVGGKTSALPVVADPASRTQIVGTVGGQPVVVGPSSVIVIGTQTLQPGGPPVTIGGNPVSLAPGGTAIVVGGKTSALPQVIVPTAARAPPVLTIGTSTLTANAATQFFISPGQTLTPGGTATVDGTVVSLGPSASFVVIGGSTQILPTAAPNANPTARPAIVVGGTTITALPTNPDNPNAHNPDSPSNPDSGPTFVVSAQTLVPGHAVTVDGTTISLAPSGSFVVINGVTSTLPAAPAAQITAPPLTIGDGVFTTMGGTGTTYQIGSALLTPGGIITVAGTTISLAPGATALIVNGVTTLLTANLPATITIPPLLTIGSHTYTAASGTTFIIDGQTLTPGGTITVDGTTISLAPGATELIYGSSGHMTTTALFPATTTRGASTTGTFSAPASAGATGRNGEVSATSSVQGAASGIKSSGIESWVFSILVGSLSLLVR